MKPSICFVSLNNYAVLSDDRTIRHIGGAEVQQSLVGRGLADRGYPVSFVTLDYGQRDGAELGKIRVFKAYGQEQGIPGLRFLHPRWSGLWRAMGRADADIYYQRGADIETGIVALWCRLRRRKFIYSIANESECFANYPLLSGVRQRRLAYYGRSHADAIISQTKFQQDLLRKEVGLQSVLIRSCAPCFDRPKALSPSQSPLSPVRLLWVGRYTSRKRLGLLLDLAEALPDVIFDIIGDSNTPSQEMASLVARARRLPNVSLAGFVPYREVGGFYDRAAALVCTSVQEGFPNTFLEAWSRGLPVISTVDPDGLVAAEQLGLVASEGTLVEATRTFLADRESLAASGQRAFEYFTRYHRPEAAIQAYMQLLNQLATPASRAAAEVYS